MTAHFPGSHYVLLNYAGDVREAYHRLAGGGAETYFAQRYSLQSFEGLLRRFEAVTVIVCVTEVRYDEVLPNGVRCIGLGLKEPIGANDITPTILSLKPTHLMISHLLASLLAWAIKQPAQISIISANSIPRQHGLKGMLKAWRLRRLLNNPRFRWIGAYSMSGARSFAAIGVSPSKIVPWDFLVQTDAVPFAPVAIAAERPAKLVYVGQLVEAKGVAEAIAAIAQLRLKGRDISLSLVGREQDASLRNLAQSLGVADHVHFVGMVANDKIEEFMRAHDAVIVPSRHEYPEGFPLVLVHALRARIPIVASDHPSFVKVLRHGKEAIIFPEKQVEALTAALEGLLADPTLYRALSEGSLQVIDRLRVELHFADILQTAFDAEGPGLEKLKANCLAQQGD